jgi:hypothetical protein
MSTCWRVDKFCCVWYFLYQTSYVRQPWAGRRECLAMCIWHQCKINNRRGQKITRCSFCTLVARRRRRGCDREKASFCNTANWSRTIARFAVSSTPFIAHLASSFWLMQRLSHFLISKTHNPHKTDLSENEKLHFSKCAFLKKNQFNRSGYR